MSETNIVLYMPIVILIFRNYIKIILRLSSLVDQIDTVYLFLCQVTDKLPHVVFKVYNTYHIPGSTLCLILSKIYEGGTQLSPLNR